MAALENYDPRIIPTDVTIDSGTTTSAIDVRGTSIVGLITPASIASSTMTLTASDTLTGTYVQVRDYLTGGAITATITSSGLYVFPPALLPCVQFVKLVFSNTETNKTFVLLTRAL